MDTYISRVCWNENEWERPSGSASELENGTFNAEYGFGHEEWLFSPLFEIDDWRYGFIQGVSRSQNKQSGKEIRLLLFTIGRSKQRYYIGELSRCFVLTRVEADKAHSALQSSGVIEEMMRNIVAINGDAEHLRDKSYDKRWALDIINIRYQPKFAIRFDPLLPIPTSSHIQNYDRYQLIPVTDEQSTEWARKTRTASRKLVLRTTFEQIIYPDEVPKTTQYSEGSVQQVLVNRYERSPEARIKCIERYGTNCFVCGFSFKAVYGEIADGYIHVHHLKRLSEIGDNYKVDPIADLRPVCPNCHAVIHVKGSCLSIEEVKRLLGR